MIDRDLFAWADARGLAVATTYRDAPVRSVDLRIGRQRYQIWASSGFAEGEVAIRAWDFQARECLYFVPVDSVRVGLDMAYRQLQGWSKTSVRRPRSVAGALRNLSDALVVATESLESTAIVDVDSPRIVGGRSISRGKGWLFGLVNGDHGQGYPRSSLEWTLYVDRLSRAATVRRVAILGTHNRDRA